MYIYTGIGSRKTPNEVLRAFVILGKALAKHDFILRSGHAPGADQAFEYGCDLYNGYKEIYIPWKGFNGSTSKLYNPSEKAFEIAKQYHKSWFQLSQAARKLHARNSHQVLGFNMSTPTHMVLCWTKNGKRDGGTGQALRIAEDHNIPIFDAGLYKNMPDYIKDVKDFLEKNKMII